MNTKTVRKQQELWAAGQGKKKSQTVAAHLVLHSHENRVKCDFIVTEQGKSSACSITFTAKPFGRRFYMEIQTASLTNSEQTLVHPVTTKNFNRWAVGLHLFSSCSAQNTVYPSALSLTVMMIQHSEKAGTEIKRKIWGHKGKGK